MKKFTKFFTDQGTAILIALMICSGINWVMFIGFILFIVYFGINFVKYLRGN